MQIAFGVDPGNVTRIKPAVFVNSTVRFGAKIVSYDPGATYLELSWLFFSFFELEKRTCCRAFEARNIWSVYVDEDFEYIYLLFCWLRTQRLAKQR